MCFGDVNEVNPIAHMLGAAYGWGGNPPNAAIYINVVPENNDGKMTYTLTVKDVPVDGFWSISVYNKAGYFEKNQYNAYVVNSVTGIKREGWQHYNSFRGRSKTIKLCTHYRRVELYRQALQS